MHWPNNIQFCILYTSMNSFSYYCIISNYGHELTVVSIFYKSVITYPELLYFIFSIQVLTSLGTDNFPVSNCSSPHQASMAS